MPERLVDIKQYGSTVHVFPVALSESMPKPHEEAFKSRALEAAAYSQLVPVEELGSLSAQMHVSRSGALEPCSDPLGVMAETKEGLEQFDRERSYRLWEEAGRPEGRSEEFWHQAQHLRFCDRAYTLWAREGRPEGKAEEHWHSVRRYEISDAQPGRSEQVVG